LHSLRHLVLLREVYVPPTASDHIDDAVGSKEADEKVNEAERQWSTGFLLLVPWIFLPFVRCVVFSPSSAATRPCSSCVIVEETTFFMFLLVLLFFMVAIETLRLEVVLVGLFIARVPGRPRLSVWGRLETSCVVVFFTYVGI